MFSQNIINLRNIKGYSQEEVAEKLGITRQAYAKWEQGLTVPDIEKCSALAKLYGTTIDALYNQEAFVENVMIPAAPKGKHIFGTVTINEKGQIVIPKKARDLMNYNPGDNLIVLCDEKEGLALVKADFLEKRLQSLLSQMREIPEE